jgi:hypothetical protein
MRNVWLNEIDKALLYLGYNINSIDMFSDSEKEALIIDEYLFRLSEKTDDVMPLSLEEMAEYIIDCQKG